MVFLFSLGNLLYFLSIYMVAPFFLYYTLNLGGNNFLYSTIIAVSSIVSSATAPFIGHISDQKGAKRITELGVFVSAIALFFLGVCKSAYTLFMAYTIIQLSMGMVCIPLQSYISKMTTTNTKKSLIPYYKSIQGVGIILGPIIGGIVVKSSLQINGYLAGIVCGIAGCLIVIVLTKQAPTVEKIDGHKNGNAFDFRVMLKKILGNKGFIMACCLFILLELSFDCINYSIPMLGNIMNISPTMVGAATSIYFFTYTLFQVPVSNILQTVPAKMAFKVMGFLSLIICLILMVPTNYLVVIFCMGAAGIVIGGLYTFCNIYVTKVTPVTERGLYLGIFQTIMPFTDTVSPIMTSSLFSLNCRAPFGFSALLFIVFLACTRNRSISNSQKT